MTAAGGFCMPTDAEYNADLLGMNIGYSIGFPEMSVARNVPRWFEPPTPAERRATEALHSLINRIVTRQQAARNAAIDAACVTAVAEGWDVHVYEPPEESYSWRKHDDELVSAFYVGIEFTPAKHPVPTVHYHQTHHYDWEDD